MIKQKIIFLEPVFKQMIWGGNRLGTDWHYDIPGDDTGECWAISAHPNGDCIVTSEPFKGISLSQLWKENPDLFGNRREDGTLKSELFPLLTKMIDAKADLSIQVHPDDEYAALHENGSLGKTECWYVLDCEEDSKLVVGHNAKDRQELKNMIEQKRWSEFIREVPVKNGDFIQIEPGTLHAIKGGILLLETQQNSDITYRVYDYDRLSNGKPRQLHIQQSIDTIKAPADDLDKCIFHPVLGEKNQIQLLMSNKYFDVSRLEVSGETTWEQTDTFCNVSVLEGSGYIDGIEINRGQHFIIPSNYGEVKVEGNMVLFLAKPNL